MRTIRENLESSIRLFKTEKVLNHIKACELVFLDLINIRGFDRDALKTLAYYQKYLIERHQSIKKVGFKKKLFNYLKSIISKFKVINLLNKCQAKKFGDGDKYLQDIFVLIRKSI